MYRVCEIFRSLQGEGLNAGRAAVFIRFAGCNLACPWCDTDHSQFSQMSMDQILDTVRALNPMLIVATGGEPLLQLDAELAVNLQDRAPLAIETNGTRLPTFTPDWITVSPKAGSRLVVERGDELKVVWPQELDLSVLEALNFDHHILQPQWGPEYDHSLALCIATVLARPRWRLGLQLHKILNVR